MTIFRNPETGERYVTVRELSAELGIPQPLISFWNRQGWIKMSRVNIPGSTRKMNAVEIGTLVRCMKERADSKKRLPRKWDIWNAISQLENVVQ